MSYIACVYVLHTVADKKFPILFNGITDEFKKLFDNLNNDTMFNMI